MNVYRLFLFPIVMLAAVILALWYVQRPAPPLQSDMTQVRLEADTGGYRLIDADTLWQLYQTGHDNLLLVDTRQEWEYNAGHITGSLLFPIEPTWWARWQGRGKLRTLLTPHKDKTIVFY